MPFIFIGLIAAAAFPFLALIGKKTGVKRKKRFLVSGITAFALMVAVATVFMFNGALATSGETAGAANPSGEISVGHGLALIGAGLSTGLACVGTGVGVASSASAAIGAISEDENLFGKSLIMVVMAEGIAIYGLLVSFLIINAI